MSFLSCQYQVFETDNTAANMGELNDTRDLKWKKQIRKNDHFREREMFTHYAKKGFASK